MVTLALGSGVTGIAELMLWISFMCLVTILKAASEMEQQPDLPASAQWRFSMTGRRMIK